MSEARVSLPVVRGFGETSRRDLWWLQPLVVFLGLATFVVYSTWAAFEGRYYYLESNGANYLSPFYSPELFGPSPHHWFGPKPAWWPGWLIFSPALLILWMPAGFRVTCYYYRGAYYKAIWADPPNCAVGEPRKSYWGENSLPLILQNVHRYSSTSRSSSSRSCSGTSSRPADSRTTRANWHFGLGVGTFVLLLNVILLGGYTFGCHSFRHLIGGRCDELAKAPTQKGAYDCVSCLNRWHMAWAWCSLFWVGFSDVYVRMCAAGYWHDWRII